MLTRFLSLATSVRTRAALLTFVAAVSVSTAKAQTPEGTVITNTATVTFTDANANTYSPVVASASVTVG